MDLIPAIKTLKENVSVALIKESLNETVSVTILLGI